MAHSCIACLKGERQTLLHKRILGVKVVQQKLENISMIQTLYKKLSKSHNHKPEQAALILCFKLGPLLIYNMKVSLTKLRQRRKRIQNCHVPQHNSLKFQIHYLVTAYICPNMSPVQNLFCFLTSSRNTLSQRDSQSGAAILLVTVTSESLIHHCISSAQHRA